MKRNLRNTSLDYLNNKPTTIWWTVIAGPPGFKDYDLGILQDHDLIFDDYDLKIRKIKEIL